MQRYMLIRSIGVIEVLIGGIAVISNLAAVIFGYNAKPPNVLLFVIVAGCISTSLGVGILCFQRRAYQLLLYFSSVVFLSKLLVSLEIIHLNNALETLVPMDIKNSISMAYHASLMIYLCSHDVKKIFAKQ